MTLYGILFYLLAIITLASTIMAITRSHVIHAVIYLILSFFSTALLFYLLGAPLLAALEVIIYAGAIMVLFLFIIMTIHVDHGGTGGKTALSQWLPAAILGAISLFAAAALIFAVPLSRTGLKTSMAGPAALGQFLFQNYWFPVEVASFLLLIALVGALYLGREEDETEKGGT